MSSLVEALTNAALGLCVSFVATLWLLPLWGLSPSAGHSAGITATFFGLSFLRAFLIREAFRKWASPAPPGPAPAATQAHARRAAVTPTHPAQGD